MIIRAFHSSQIAWGFRSTIEEIPTIRQEGIWIPDFQQARKQGQEIGPIIGEITTGGETEAVETSEVDEDDSDEVTDEKSDEESQDEEEEMDDDDEEEEEEDQAGEKTFTKPTPSRSAFALLALDGGDASAEEESESE